MADLVVLLIEPKSSGIDIISAAHALGFGVHILDRLTPNELAEPVRAAVETGRVGFTHADTRSPGPLLDAAKQVMADVGVAAAVPGFEYAVPTTALVATALGLRGPTPVAAEAMRDKARMKRVLANAGVPVAAGRVIPTPDGRTDDRSRAALVTTIADVVGFPAVVKPVDGSGSQWVRRVDGEAELDAHLVDIAANRYDDEGLRVGARLLVERYVAGREISVEGYVADGEVRVAALTEKQLGPEPYFVEIGHIVQARVGAAEREAVTRATAAAVGALGLSDGAFHLEARLGAEGPVVLEVGARLSGDRITRLVSAVHGIDLPQALVCALAGRPVPAAGPGVAGAAAARFFTVARPGRLTDPDRLTRRLAELPGCVEVELYPAARARLEAARDFRHRFGHAVLTAPDRTVLAQRLADLDRLVATAVDDEP